MIRFHELPDGERLVASAAGGRWLQEAQPAAKPVVFEQSGRCPMWEEPERFNQVGGERIERR